MKMLPILPKTDMKAIVAYHGNRPITQSEFLGDIEALATNLPVHTRHVINLCKDRYWFSATLFACISRGILTLLPNSIAPEIVAELVSEFPDLLCLGDQNSSVHPLPYLQVSIAHTLPSLEVPKVPSVPFDLPILRVYTSGSTGKPQGHIKTFGRLCQCATAEAERLWTIAGGPCAVVGTVPFQHMYGLESTIFLPLLGNGQLTARLPFFPADVLAALLELPAPRILVTTPFHLRKLVESNQAFPSIAAIISATAPLSLELAESIENRLGAPVVEIYGSTETGQIATRLPTHNPRWLAYDGIVLKQEHGLTTAMRGHLEGPQVLNDMLELHSSSQFQLLGRNSDMVNIVGKRSSLAYLNQIIIQLPGVTDGVFFSPKTESEHEVSRLAAFVVAPKLQLQDIQSSLLQKLDPVFLPRPIIFLDALPRDGNGKIPASVMTELITRHLS
ncbi:MAG: acyl-CoA synthetase [Ferrovum sp.]|nr:acyl-CoA synthetase [Ferrovum sp.]